MKGITIAAIILSMSGGIWLYAASDGKHTPVKSAGSELKNWQAEVSGQIARDKMLEGKVFDRFFNDEFFRNHSDPFAEMERIRKEMRNMFSKTDMNVFNSSWDKWFKERMRMDEFRTQVSRTDKNVIVAISVPGIKLQTEDISVSKGRIKISFNAVSKHEEKKNGGVVKSEISKSYEKIMPVPEDAVPRAYDAKIQGDTIRITFARKPKPAGKSTVK